jgi:hypothetical protein
MSNYAYILCHGFYVLTLVAYHVASNGQGLENDVELREREEECCRRMGTNQK